MVDTKFDTALHQADMLAARLANQPTRKSYYDLRREYSQFDGWDIICEINADRLDVTHLNDYELDAIHDMHAEYYAV